MHFGGHSLPTAKLVAHCPQGRSCQPPELSPWPRAVRCLSLTKAGVVSPYPPPSESCTMWQNLAHPTGTDSPKARALLHQRKAKQAQRDGRPWLSCPPSLSPLAFHVPGAHSEGSATALKLGRQELWGPHLSLTSHVASGRPLFPHVLHYRR